MTQLLYMHQSPYKDWVTASNFCTGSVLQLCMTPALLHELVLNVLPFETPVEVCRGGGTYCYLQTHSSPSCSFLTLQSDPAPKAASAIHGQRLLFFLGFTGKHIAEGTASPLQSSRGSCEWAALTQLYGRLEEAWEWSQSGVVGKPCTLSVCMPAEV